MENVLWNNELFMSSVLCCCTVTGSGIFSNSGLYVNSVVRRTYPVSYQQLLALSVFVWKFS